MEPQNPTPPAMPAQPGSPLQQGGESSAPKPPTTEKLGLTVPTPAPTASQIARQNEAEELAWVEKAKSIIAATTGDPFERHRALNELRAQYLNQRFGKDING